MDTNISAVESSEDININIENPLSPHPETLENSDIILFKQQLSKSNTTLRTDIPISELYAGQEDVDDLIDLSHEFENFLQREKQLLKVNGTPSQASAKSTYSSDKTNTQTTPAPTKNNLDKPADRKGFITSNEVKHDPVSKDLTIKEKTLPSQTSAKSTYSSDKTETVSKDFDFQGNPSKEEIPLHIQENPFMATSDTPLTTNLTPSSNVTVTTASHVAMISQQIKDQIIDRILVSTNDLATDKTVRVIINPTVLESTEVNFQKIGDTLSVQFVSRSESSLSFLQTNQTDLQGYLQNELKQFKGVSVAVKSSENNAGQPGDGRSRNRYDYQALDEDEQ